MEVYLNRRQKLAASHPIIEKATKEIYTVKHNRVGIDTVCSRRRRLKLASGEGPRQLFGKVHVDFEIRVHVQTRQAQVKPGVSSGLGDEFLASYIWSAGSPAEKKSSTVPWIGLKVAVSFASAELLT